MADILAELEGIIGKEAADKIRGNDTARARVERASEIFSFYEGETETPPAPPSRREPTPASGVPAPAAGSESLAAIMAKLDGLGDIDKKIADGVAAVVNARGSELRGAAVADSIKITRELSKLDARHRADFSEDLDDTKLEAHIAKARDEGRPFRTVSDAYDDMTREARIAKEVSAGIATGVRDQLKERASGNLPGVTPQAATPMLQMLKTSRRGTGSSDAGNHLDKAGTALAERLAASGTFIPQ